MHHLQPVDQSINQLISVSLPHPPSTLRLVAANTITRPPAATSSSHQQHPWGGSHLDLPPIGTTSTGTLQLRLGRTIPTVLSVPALGSLCAFACSSYEGVRGSMQDRHALPKIRETAHHGSCYGTAGNQHTDTLAQGQTQCGRVPSSMELKLVAPVHFSSRCATGSPSVAQAPGAPLPATYRHVTALFFCNFVLRLLVGDHSGVLVTRSCVCFFPRVHRNVRVAFLFP